MRLFSLPAVLVMMGLILLAAVVVTDGILKRGKASQKANQPDVVLIVLDTTRPDHLGCYGHARRTSPNLDELARDSIVFERAFASAPWTLPSHASLFTGLLPSEHGCHFEHRYLIESNDTLAERLLARGYETGGFSSNVNVSHFFNLNQGFSTFVEVWRERDANPGKTDTEITTQEVQKWLQGVPRSKPLFLFVNLMDPHLPYWPRESFRRPFYDASRGAPRAAQHGDLLDLVMRGEVKLSDQVRAELRDLYDAEIAAMDAELEHLLTLLGHTRSLDDTLLIITSDHGEHLGENGLVEHQLSIDDVLLRVPLIVRYPRALRAPQRVTAAVETRSLFDFTLNVVDGGRPPISELWATAAGRRVMMAEFHRPFEIEERLPHLIPAGMLARKCATRLIDGEREWSLITIEGEAPQLYSPIDDPLETHPVNDTQVLERVVAAANDLRASLRKFDEPFEQVNPDIVLDAPSEEGLRTLGYLAGPRVPRSLSVHAAEHVHLGRRAAERGEVADAIRHLTLACALAHDSADALFELARVLESTDRLRAYEAYQRYLSVAGNRPEEAARKKLVQAKLATFH